MFWLIQARVANTSYQSPEIRGYIDGRVLLDGAPQVGIRRKVALLSLVDHKPRAIAYSDGDGVFLARDLAMEPHVLVSSDPTGEMESVAAGVVMPTLQEF